MTFLVDSEKPVYRIHTQQDRGSSSLVFDSEGLGWARVHLVPFFLSMSRRLCKNNANITEEQHKLNGNGHTLCWSRETILLKHHFIFSAESPRVTV